jgi:hypothetical protein
MALIYGKLNQTTYGTNASDEIHVNGKDVAEGLCCANPDAAGLHFS